MIFQGDVLTILNYVNFLYPVSKKNCSQSSYYFYSSRCIGRFSYSHRDTNMETIQIRVMVLSNNN